MLLLVGLGNPGARYARNRHNVGFMVADTIAKRHALGWRHRDQVLLAKNFGADAFLVAKPLTYVNRSGDVVGELMRYYGVGPEDLLVIVDEAALPFGRLRARARGSAGGHNGLKSIIERLETTEFARLRLGVGRGDPRRDLADHVLARFEPGERAELEAFIARAADAAEMFAVEGIEKVMNQYNPEATAPEVD